MPDILIIPNRSSTSAPEIQFSGSANASASIKLQVLPEGQVAFVGKSGSLFSIVDSMSGSLMAVSDISGLPILEVSSDDKVVMGKYNRPALVVTGSQVLIAASASVYNGSGFNYSLVVGNNYGTTGYIAVMSNSDAGLVLDSRTITPSSGLKTSLYSSTGTVGMEVAKGSSYGSGTNFIFYYTPGATAATDTLQFQSGGSAAMTINGSQNVAIGKTAPINAKLDVNGNSIVSGSFLVSGSVGIGINPQNDRFEIQTSTSNYSMRLVASTSNFALIRFINNAQNNQDATIGTSAANTLSFYTNGFNERMRIDASGNVTIAKTTANAVLDVNGNSIITGSLVVTGTSALRGATTFGIGSTTGTSITINEYTAGTARNWGIRDDSGVDRLRFSRGSSDYAFWDVLKTAASDNVSAQIWNAITSHTWGINGSNIFQVTANASATYGTGASVYAIDSTVQTRIVASLSATIGIVETATNHALVFRVNQSEKMRIATGGNVGIGIDTPDAKLHVRTSVDPVLLLDNIGGNNVYINLRSGTGLDATGEISFERTGANNGNFYYGGNAAGQHIFRSNGYATRMSLDGSGNLSVTGNLTVNGSSIPQNSQSAAYTLVAADANKHIYHPSADTTARTWTIPANSSVPYAIGTAITFVNDSSAGTITISINTDTLVLAPNGTTGSRTLAANGVATAIKVTSTRWIISGTNLS